MMQSPILLIFLSLFSFTTAWASSRCDENAERDFCPQYAHLATGTLANRKTFGQRYIWPVSVLSIGHTIASYQKYVGSAYFHHGIDIRADAGSPVIASAGGKVINIENYVPGNPAYWEIAILDAEGFIWQYHHVDRSSIPAAIQDAFKKGLAIPTGAKLGEVYYWPEVTFGERFHHIHLNILGAQKSYLNGFAFLESLDDKVGPQIHEIALVQNGKKVKGNSVSGPYTMAAELSDLILHDKFIVPPHVISFSINGGKKQTVWRFDNLPGGSSNTKYIHDFYLASETCGDYDCRKLVVNLGFSKDGPVSFPTAGSHQIEVTAEDYEGNKVSREYRWVVY
ncbi:MAG: M23 family metallopeptidase [Deltaproteobacteria bacterium]|nr:M23 family metallopeptidase [Deltaproteobacteria bacterium]